MCAKRSYLHLTGGGLLIAALAGLAFALFRQSDVVQAQAGDRAGEMKRAYGRLPMSFEANQGQADSEVKFLSRGHGYQVFLTEHEVVLRLMNEKCGAPGGECGRSNGLSEQANLEQHASILRFKLQNARSEAQVAGVDRLPGKSNYLIGNDPAGWQTGISNYARVEYREVYPGISLAYYGSPQALEYDFIVQPGADPGQIAMSIDGAGRIELDENGDLVMHVAGEKIYQRAPVVYQKFGGARRNVTSRFALQGGNRIGFEVGDYDASRPLVIDPVIDYSTFFGGIGSDEGFAIAVDGSGNAYVTGTTYSNNFNTFAPLQTINRGGKFDAFVTKINAAGSAIVYSTYLGGSAEDSGGAIAVDAGGNACIAGITNSPDFNVRNALQPTITGLANDAFVAKVNASGTELLFSTYLGGSDNDQAFGIALDLNGSGGDVSVAGSTASANFPLKNPVQGNYRGNTDAFVAKIKSDGSQLVYSTYLGGSLLDEASGIAVDAGGNAYLTGTTSSTDFTTSSALQPNSGGGGSDAFAAKLNAQGSQLLFSTYIGGSGVDVGYGVAVDLNLNAYLTGHTFSTDFPVQNAFQAINQGNADAYLVRLNLTGGGFVYSTYLGGSGGDFGRGVVVDQNSTPSVVGRTISTDFNTKNPLQATNRGEFDAFVAKFTISGTQLVYATYLGGASDDLGFGIAVDSAGNAYVTGDTRSTDFNTKNPLQAANRGGIDAFVTKINATGSALTYSTYLGGSGEDLGLSIALDAAGNAYITGYTSSNDFTKRNPIQAASRGGLEVFVTKIFADASDIAFSTYFGGNGSDTGAGIAVDSIGSCYVTGATTSTNLPTRNPIQPTNRGGLDAFVVKFNPDGSNIVYSTYLGGGFGDLSRGVAVDLAGNAFLVGSTFSTDFPTVSPFQAENRGNGDAFAARINSTGTALFYSSYLGGAGTDEGAGIAVDAGGNAYVVGNTASGDFNTKNPLQPNNRGQQDVFVTKVSQTGSTLVYSTYLGGQRLEVGNGIALDVGNNVYITGTTSSGNFPVQNALQPTYGGGEFDAFVTKINAAGAVLTYSTYLGGSLIEVGNAVAVDLFGNCYVTGVTNSTNFPLKNPLQTDNRGGNEAFITKLNQEGSALVYSTYLGGGNDDRGSGIAVDAAGTAYVTGATSSPNFNIQFPLLAYGGGTDVFVAKILSETSLSLSPSNVEIQIGSTAVLTVTLSSVQTSATTVTLTSSNPNLVSAPQSVTVPGGSASADFTVNSLAVGGPVIITAALSQALGGATATSMVNVVTSNRFIQAASVRAAGGGLVTVPIDLVSQGNENRLTFSLAIDPTLLLNPQFTLGGDAGGATLNTVLAQSAQGRFGISIALPAGQRFEAGTRQVLVLTAVVITGSNATTTNLNFGDQPTVRRITDISGQSLSTNYTNGVITIAQGFEGDVSPRPSGSSGSLTIADWVQTGRFAAGFDLAAVGSEFQRADTAPRGTLGSGAITVSDWVQTGRYAAGLDPVVPAGGPTGPTVSAMRNDECGMMNERCEPFSFSVHRSSIIIQQTRVIRVVPAAGQRGQQVTVSIECDAQGDENAFGFSLNFDAAQLTFNNAVLGADASAGILNVNNTTAAQGRVGIALALPAGQAIAAGTKKIVGATFTIAANSTSTAFAISFVDQPVVREVVNVNADVLQVTWTPGTVAIPRPVASVSAASYLGAELAPESIVAAFGTELSTTTQVNNMLPLPTEIAGTTVRVRDGAGVGRLAPLFFVAPTQVNYLLPAGTAPGTATVTVTSGVNSVSIGSLNVAAVAPALFSASASGQGLAAATVLRVKSNGQQIFEPVGQFDPGLNRFTPVPIDLGPVGEDVFLLAFGTGMRGRSSLAAVNIKLGGVTSEVLYLGAQGDFIGVDQGNIRIPRSLIGRGEIDVVVTVDGKVANLVKVAIK